MHCAERISSVSSTLYKTFWAAARAPSCWTTLGGGARHVREPVIVSDSQIVSQLPAYTVDQRQNKSSVNPWELKKGRRSRGGCTRLENLGSESNNYGEVDAASW